MGRGGTIHVLMRALTLKQADESMIPMFQRKTVKPKHPMRRVARKGAPRLAHMLQNLVTTRLAQNRPECGSSRVTRGIHG